MSPVLPVAVDAFGDPFQIETLKLPRPAIGYGVQQLGTDYLLNRHDGRFLPIRSRGLDPAFPDFASAHDAASHWIATHGKESAEHQLAIVPVGYDPVCERPVLIYGVLFPTP